MKIAAARLPQTQTVPRAACLPYEEFVRDYLLPRRPVVFTDATSAWAAVGKWTPNFLKERCGDKTVEIDGEPYNFGDFLDRVDDPAPAVPIPYLRNQDVMQLLPELVADVEPTPDFFQPNWLFGTFRPAKLNTLMQTLTTREVFIGGKGGSFPNLHIDSARTHAFLNQIYGRKELILYGPEQTEFVYPQPHKDISQIENVEQPDLARFPRFAQAVPLRVTIEAGDTAFIPAGWWHTARMSCGSITLSVNTANASNWNDLTDEVTRHQPAPIRAALRVYLRALGKQKVRIQ